MVLVQPSTMLDRLHIGDIRCGMADVEADDILCVDEHAAPLGAVTRAGSTFVYRYDFGDDWDHEITVERVTDVELKRWAPRGFDPEKFDIVARAD